MKTRRWNVIIAFVVTLLFGLKSSALAGPGPQYWAQQRAKTVPAAEAKEQAKMSCPKCKDSAVKTIRAAVPGGKRPARSEVIGAKHTCAACGGEIKTIQGKTTNDMKLNCLVCAKAESNCCKI